MDNNIGNQNEADVEVRPRMEINATQALLQQASESENDNPPPITSYQSMPASNISPRPNRSRSANGRPAAVHRHPIRNIVAFWLLGLCNNFAYVVMLSAAKDILEGGGGGGGGTPAISTCVDDVSKVSCSPISTGAVLLADILPSLTVKLIAPFTLRFVPYTLRHCFVVVFQASSFLIVAFSRSLAPTLLGVVFASLGSGLGEITYLSMSSHFNADVVSGWSSGTGGAGIVGSLAFALLTDRHLGLGLAPRTSLLLMLVVPSVLFLTYAQLLRSPASVHRRRWGLGRRNIQWRLNAEAEGDNEDRGSRRPLLAADSDSSQLIGHAGPNNNNDVDGLREESVAGNELDEGEEDNQWLVEVRHWELIRPLLRFMLPLFFVYLAEYFINQGLVELLLFSCARGFRLSPTSQYRWYQVLYQLGVFISRSSVKLFPIKASLLPALAILQVVNVGFLFREAMLPYIPHIVFLFFIILYEGLLGGAAYANTFNAVHKTVREGAEREFSMGFVALADSVGVVTAGFSSIYAHNFICSHRRL